MICSCCGLRKPGTVRQVRDERNAEILRLYQHGHSSHFIAEKYELSRSAVWQAIKRASKGR